MGLVSADGATQNLRAEKVEQRRRGADGATSAGCPCRTWVVVLFWGRDDEMMESLTGGRGRGR